MSDIKTIKQVSKAVEPAKRWRNKWFTENGAYGERTGNWHPPGEYWGIFVFPSKDVAESRALAAIDRVGGMGRGSKYLGAFPIDS